MISADYRANNVFFSDFEYDNDHIYSQISPPEFRLYKEMAL